MITSPVGRKALSPEARLVVALLGFVFSSDGETSLEDLVKCDERFDWQEVLRLATFHRLTAPLWISLKRAHLENQVPALVQQALFDGYMMNLAVDAVQEKELRSLVRAFDEEGIDLIVLKGLPLHRLLFGAQEYPRGASDIDLLVHREDVDRSVQLLNRLNFLLTPEEGRTVEWYTRFSYQFQFVKREGVRFPVMAELHWSATADFFGSGASFESILNIWEEVKVIQWNDSRLRILSEENLLFYQAFHMFSDWKALTFAMVLDFCRLAQILWPSVSKQQLAEKGKRFGFSRVLAAATQVASFFYDLPEFHELKLFLRVPPIVSAILARMIKPGRILQTGRVDWQCAFFSFYPFDLLLGTTRDSFTGHWRYRFRHSRWFQPTDHTVTDFSSVQ